MLDKTTLLHWLQVTCFTFSAVLYDNVSRNRYYILAIYNIIDCIAMANDYFATVLGWGFRKFAFKASLSYLNLIVPCLCFLMYLYNARNLDSRAICWKNVVCHSLPSKHGTVWRHGWVWKRNSWLAAPVKLWQSHSWHWNGCPGVIAGHIQAH